MISQRYAFGRRRWGVVALTVLVPLGAAAVPPSTSDAAAGTEPSDSAPADEKAELRLRYMLKALQKYHVVLDGDEGRKADLDEKVQFRWSNPVGDVADGLLTVYTPEPDARPAAIAHFHVHGPVLNGLEMHEFADVHPGKVELYRGRDKVWSPERRYGEFRTLQGGPKPAADPALRLAQIKRMAERFEVIDGFRAPNSEPQPQPLRMMPRPTYRYGRSEGRTLTDGALFTYVLATDPEACLLVEVRDDGDSHVWEYAFFPMTIYSLEAKLDGQPVWEKPEAMVFGDSAGPHYIAAYQGDAGEPSLRTIAPTTGDGEAEGSE